jgi:hypothetical protein
MTKDYKIAELGKGMREPLIILLDKEAAKKIPKLREYFDELATEGRTICPDIRYIVCRQEGYQYTPNRGFEEKSQMLGNVRFDGKALGNIKALLHFLDADRDFVTEVYGDERKKSKPIELIMIPHGGTFELWTDDMYQRYIQAKAAQKRTSYGLEDKLLRADISPLIRGPLIQPAR